MKQRSYIIVFFITISLLLASCSTITRRAAQLSGGHGYLHVETTKPRLMTHPPTVDLSQYQSVHNRAHATPHITIALAASGGGYRASNLTAGVMMGLEKKHLPQLNGNLLQGVDYFSTVSGGGFPIGLYLSNLYRTHLLHPENFGSFSFADLMLGPQKVGARTLRKDYSGDLFFGYRDTLHLEQQLGKDMLSVTPNRELQLGDIYIPQSSKKIHVVLPMWVANASIFQNMNLFPFAPNVLSSYQITAYMHNQRQQRLQQSPMAYEYGLEMPAAVGMTASASFPYAVAGTTLWSSACKSDCYLQLFDGGLADNLGVFTAVNLLKQDKNKIKILIVVDAYKDDLQPFSKSRTPPRKFQLLHKVTQSGLESLRNHIKDNITTVTKGVLCKHGTTNVLVAYLDVDQYPEVRDIPTSLWMDANSQQQLLQIGEELVRNNVVLNQQLPRLLAGDLRVGSCKEIS